MESYEIINTWTKKGHFQKYDAKWKNPGTKEYTLHDVIYIKS